MQAVSNRQAVQAALVGFAAACEVAKSPLDTGAALAFLCARAGEDLASEASVGGMLSSSRKVLSAYESCSGTKRWRGRLCAAKRFEVHSRLASISRGDGALLRLVDGTLRLTAGGIAEALLHGFEAPTAAAVSRGAGITRRL